MNEIFTDEIVGINNSIDPHALLQKMGIEGESVYVEGDQIRIYCPIHRDIVKRSMLIDSKERSFKCAHVHCEAHAGGPLIQLYSMFFGLTAEEAIQHLNSGPMDQGQMISEADHMIDRGELSSAIPVLKKVLEADPKNETNRCKLAALYLELGDQEAGFKEYLLAAEDFAVRGQLSKTVSIYKLLLIISPKNLKLRNNLFHVFRRLERYDDAIEQLKSIADDLFQRQEYDRVLKVCNEMLEVMPAEPTIREFLARVLSVRGDNVGAATEAENAAKLYFELGRLREAGAAIDFGLELAPNNKILLTLKEALINKRKEADVNQAMLSATGEMSEEAFEGWVMDLEEEVGKEDVEEAPPVVIAPPPIMTSPDNPFNIAAYDSEQPVTAERTGEGSDLNSIANPFKPAAESHVSNDNSTVTVSAADTYFARLQSLTKDQHKYLGRFMMTVMDNVKLCHHEGFLPENEWQRIEEFYGEFQQSHERALSQSQIISNAR